MNARVRRARGFMNGQRVHIRTQSDGTIGSPRGEHAHETCLADPLVHRNAPSPQAFSHQALISAAINLNSQLDHGSNAVSPVVSRAT